MSSTVLLHFLVSFSLLISRFSFVHGILEYKLGCNGNIMLESTQRRSGILVVQLPSSFAEYQEANRHCDITINYRHNVNLLIDLYYLDIIPIDSQGGCNTGLSIFDSTRDIYGRVCGNAKDWERQHRENKMKKRISVSTPITFRLTSQGAYKGNGFKVHFNEFRPTIPCYTREFKCEEFQRCVHDDLTCDGWDDCGDNTDEKREAGCHSLTGSEICACIIGILFIFGTVAILVIFFLTYRRRSSDYSRRFQSKIPIADDSRSILDSQMTLSRHYNSQESVNKSAYSRNTNARRDSFDSVNKMELEKSDRGPESVASDKKSRHALNDRKSPRNGTPPKMTVSERDKKSPDRDRGSRDRSRDRSLQVRGYRDQRSDHYSNSDQSDDRDKYDNRGYRRRHSRERNRDHYSDDSDYERDHRRRRRSYERHSDEDSDSGREREMRRRRRSRDRYRDRYDDRDKTDSEERSSDRLREKEDEKERDSDKQDDIERDYNRPYPRRASRERDSDKQDDIERDYNRPYPRRASRERGRDRYRDHDGEVKGKGREEEPDRRRSAERRPYREDNTPSRQRGHSPDQDVVDKGPLYNNRHRSPSPDREILKQGRRNNDRRRGPSPDREMVNGGFRSNEDRRQNSTDNLREERRSASRDQDHVVPPPTSEDIRRLGIEDKPPEIGDLGREALREYNRRSIGERRERRRSRGRQQDRPTSEGPSTFV